MAPMTFGPAHRMLVECMLPQYCSRGKQRPSISLSVASLEARSGTMAITRATILVVDLVFVVGLLSWEIATSRGETMEEACAVDNPYGSCLFDDLGTSDWCFSEHESESSQCREELKNSAERVNDMAPVSHPPVCDKLKGDVCNSQWYVDYEAAARCYPDVVDVAFHQFNAPNKLYIVEVHWKYTEPCRDLDKLVGVQVSLDSAGLVCSDDGVGGAADSHCCYCISTEEREGWFNITVMYATTPQIRAIVSTFPRGPDSDSFYTKKSDPFDGFENCYDSRLQVDLDRCGIPRYGKPTNVHVTSGLIPGTDLEMNATIAWDPPSTSSQYPSPTEYYIRIRANTKPNFLCGSGSDDTLCFKVTNSTQLTVTHLNASYQYFVDVEPYGNCTGVADPDYYVNGCGHYAETSFMYETPNFSTAIAIPMVTPTATSRLPPTATDDSSSSPKSLVAGLSVGILVLLVLVVVAVLFGIVRKVVRKRRRRRDRIIDSSYMYQETGDGEIWRDPCSGERCPSGEQCPPAVVVVYSDSTPKLEKEAIMNHLIGPLRDQYGVDCTSHDNFVSGDALVYQISESMRKANTVLCVCSPAFCKDWNSDQPPTVTNALKLVVGADITTGGNLRKFALVFVYDQDKKHVPHDFLKGLRQFLISDLEGIVRFVNNTTTYEVVPLNR